MTKPRYDSCAAGSQVHGIAAPAGYAWNVNLDDGNSNRNHQDNKNFVRAVRAGECQSAVHFRDLHSAWRRARAGKKPSSDQATFDANWIEGLLDLQERLAAHTWRPSPPTCFIASAPKAREIHAPAFADRVVHHWLVPRLETLYEPIFIHDSYSNRVGKGTHAAVNRLQAFVRQVYSGQRTAPTIGQPRVHTESRSDRRAIRTDDQNSSRPNRRTGSTGSALDGNQRTARGLLQLPTNCLGQRPQRDRGRSRELQRRHDWPDRRPGISDSCLYADGLTRRAEEISLGTSAGNHEAKDHAARPIGGGWYLQLDIRNFFNSIHRPTLYAMLKARMERHGLPEPHRRAVHALLATSVRQTDVRWACTPTERAAVPPHKRLENAPRGCGIAIGNLSSQFFANVYLDRLDQFVKHTLRAVRYLRYVDDFVLVHRDRAQLEAWRTAIEAFLAETLHLQLKADQRLRPLRAGIDFLGYVIFPAHRVVRRRVVAHVCTRLTAFEHAGALSVSHARAEALRSVWASYQGHFRHACTYRLQAFIHARYPWLRPLLSGRFQ